MAKITLRLEADASKASAVLANLKKEAQSLSGQKIDLGIDAKDAQAIAKAAKALADLQRAELAATREIERRKKEEAAAAREAAKTARADQDVAMAKERRASADARASAEAAKTARADQEAAIAADKRGAAEANATAATERHAAADANAAAAAERRQTAETNLQNTLEKRTNNEERHNQRMEEMAYRTEHATSSVSAFSVALGSLASRAVRFAITKITQSIREALDTMKDVDTELTNISKVSGITGKALADMGVRAYETASRYGVAADEYLSAVYTFQKAGLGPSAEAMGELAIKTMLVGDTTADVATQFLISANAAWKFGGNMERLGQIVDEADYINNNYATTLDKLSSGLPRVASIAAQAGMSAEETLAALATITAVTQESGTKAATALRALILNIEGQIGTFVDDTGEEFEVTEESVKSMQGLMEKYAQAEIEAARASGELINPMTAIQAIFEGMANSDLNDQELFQLLSGMGGKLRTNQLTALVQNYELFNEILGKIAGSAGTADSEIALMMESWERKTQVLKNTWTEFISDIIDSDKIKGYVETLSNVIAWFDDLYFSSPWGTEDKQSTYQDAQAELDALKAKSGELNDIERARLAYLEAQTKELEKQANKAAETEAKWLKARLGAQDVTSYYDSQGNFVGTPTTYYGGEGQLNNLRGQYRESSVLASQGDIKGYQSALKEIISDNQEYYDQLVQINEAGVELSSTQQTFVDNFEEIQAASEANIVSIRDLGDGYQALIDDSGNIIAKVENWQRVEEEAANQESDRQQTLDEVNEKLSEAIENGGNVAAVAEEISFDLAAQSAAKLASLLWSAAGAASSISVGAMPGFASGTSYAPGGPTLVNELGPELISQNGRAFIANGGRPAVVNLQRGAVVIPADQTQAALRGGMPIRAAAGGIMDWMTPNGTSVTSTAEDVIPGAIAVLAEIGRTYGKDKVGNVLNAGGGGGGGGGSSVKAPTLEELVEKFDDLLTNLDKQAKLANNEGDYAREAQLYEQAQEAIKKMVEDYRKAGYKDDSDEILDLLNKNYEYANKQLSLYQTKWDELIKALEADTDAQDLANKLAEKQQAVDDARAALANAQKQRTIRMFNAATGQWEWVADQSAVENAQNKISSAEEAYAKELKSQAIQELENAKSAGLALEDIVLGPALSAVALLSEETDEFQNFARALNAVYGVGSFLQSTEGSTKAIATADSHDINYTFGNVTLTEEQASSMSVAELARKLQVLKIS